MFNTGCCLSYITHGTITSATPTVMHPQKMLTNPPPDGYTPNDRYDVSVFSSCRRPSSTNRLSAGEKLVWGWCGQNGFYKGEIHNESGALVFFFFRKIWFWQIAWLGRGHKRRRVHGKLDVLSSHLRCATDIRVDLHVRAAASAHLDLCMPQFRPSGKSTPNRFGLSLQYWFRGATAEDINTWEIYHPLSCVSGAFHWLPEAS